MDDVQIPTTFWSRRRAAVEAEAAVEAAAHEARAAAAAQQALAAEQAEKTDAEILAELGLKDPDQMVAGDDFSVFMRSAVPERLRRRALRVLWRSNPVLANLDGLLDHDDDFSDAATVAPNMKTAYQVGKGMLRHVQVLAEQARTLAGNEPAEVLEDATTVEAFSGIVTAEQAPAITEAPVQISASGQVNTMDDSGDYTQRRHMRFEFSDQQGESV